MSPASGGGLPPADPWRLLDLPDEGPLASHPHRPLLAWALGRAVWRWTPSDGATVWTWLRADVLDLLVDADGWLWTVDATGVAVWEGAVERDRWDGLGGELLRVGEGGVELVHRGWMDGYGPVSRAWRLSPGEEPEERPVEGPAPPVEPPGTLPGGRYRVRGHDGRRWVEDAGRSAPAVRE